MKIPFFTLAALSLQTISAPSTSQTVVKSADRTGPATPPPFSRAELAKRGVEVFAFSGWDGPSLPIWYFRPAGTPADAPVLFVFHGVQRDADRYIGQWVELAAKEKIIIVVPEFGRAAFPGARGYNHGNLFDAKGKATPASERSFALIEPLFDALRQRGGLTRETYWMFGHSAGAQFVHRFALTGHSRRAEQLVSANAGSYMMPDPAISWPFGVDGLPDGLWDPHRAYATRMTVLLGTADNDPNYPSLPRDAEAMAQGPHRLARGHKFYAVARTDADRQKLPFAWNCALAPGIGHDNGGMAPFAIAILKQSGKIIACDNSDPMQASGTAPQ